MIQVVSNTAMSLDGKIATAQASVPFLGSAIDRKRMHQLRDRFDAILVGGNTFRAWPHPSIGENSTRQKTLNVILSRSLEIVFSKDCFNSDVDWLVLTDNKNIPSMFPVEVEVCEPQVSAAWILNVLERRGVKNLLLEGGGEILSLFLKENLLHEMYVTLCPKIIGGKKAPTLVGGDGFLLNELKKLKLLQDRKSVV